MKNFYFEKLQLLKEKNLHRVIQNSDSSSATTIRRGKKNLISFACNDYLGLSQNPQIKRVAISAIKKFGVGARASRFLTGNNSLYQKLEKSLAQYKDCEDALVFSSGYACAIGVIPALVGEGDLIIADRLIHSCLLDGAKLSAARLMRFQHNSISHCAEILQSHRAKFKKCIIITETVFSMDGDLGKIPELLDLAKKFQCFLISDDAHGLGFKNFSSAEYLQMGTLSKAFGALGGYIAGDKILIDYLRNFARSVIYSTALPPAILAGALASLKIISQKKLSQKALNNAQYFCNLLALPKPESAVVVIIIGDNKRVVEIAKIVEAQGFLISAIRPPTVENGKARLRITFSALHKKSQIKRLCEILKTLIN